MKKEMGEKKWVDLKKSWPGGEFRFYVLFYGGEIELITYILRKK